jgi:hypothetical protein
MNPTVRAVRSVRAPILAALVAALAGSIAGCQQYSTYPEIPSAKGIPENPNNPSAAVCMRTAVQYVMTRWSPGGPAYDAATAEEQASLRVPTPLVINLPRGLRRIYYERVAADIGPQTAPMSPDALASGAPVIHVTRVWLRFNKATVDVLRPVPELGPGPDGKPIYQTITVRLEGGLDPWRVVHARAYDPGFAEVPEPYPIPELDRVDQYEITAAEDRAYKPGLAGE